jgi:hypothetical protein
MTKPNTAAPIGVVSALRVVLGTSGSHDYLRDRTAGQRFWRIDPVQIGRVRRKARGSAT